MLLPNHLKGHLLDEFEVFEADSDSKSTEKKTNPWATYYFQEFCVRSMRGMLIYSHMSFGTIDKILPPSQPTKGVEGRKG